MQPALNGSGPGEGLVDYVPTDLREEFAAIFESEGMMTESAENRLLTAINKNHGEVRGDIRALESKMGELDDQVRDTKRDVGDLKEWKKTVTEDKQATGRTAKDSVIRYTIGGLVAAVFTLLGVVGTVILRPTLPTPAPAAVQPATQGSITRQELKEILEEMRGDREALKPATSKPKPKAAPEPQRLNQLKERDFVVDSTLPIYAHLLPPWEAIR